MGHMLRSAALLGAAVLVLVLRQQFVIGDALAVPLVVLFVGGFIVSVLWAVRRTEREAQTSSRTSEWSAPFGQ